MLTWNATLLFGGLILLGFIMALFFEIDRTLACQLKEGKQEFPSGFSCGVNYLFMFFAAVILVLVTFNTNQLVFYLLIGADIIFIIVVIYLWCTRVFDQGYNKLFSCYLCCFFIMCMVVVYSFCAKADVDTSKNTNLSDTYLVEDVVYYEYAKLKKNGILIYEENNGKKIAKNIPFNQIICEVAENGFEQAEPYVYREKRVYEKLNHKENPPTVMEEKEVVWTDYIFSGTEELVKQIMEKKQ